MNVLLAKVGEELCNVVWQKTERGEDDRFKVDDLPIIFAAACAAAIRRSPDKTKRSLALLRCLVAFLQREGVRGEGRREAHFETEGAAADNTRVDLAVELQKIYESEINIRIGWLWDGGIEVRLGDEMNGFMAEENVATVADIVPWLQEAIAHFYPASTYAGSLNPEIRERGTKRLFSPPTVGAQVTCPHCGAPHAAPPGMSELIQFVCVHCGNSVAVAPPKIQ